MKSIMAEFGEIQEKTNHLQKLLNEFEGVPEKLVVKHDTYEYDVVVNGIECTYCGTKEHESEKHAMGDVDMCDSCYEGMVA